MKAKNNILPPIWTMANWLYENKIITLHDNPGILIKKAIKFYVKDVAEWVYQMEGKRWDIQKDIPIATPPFKMFWMERGPVNKIRNDLYLSKEAKKILPIPIQTGALIMSEKKEDGGWKMRMVVFARYSKNVSRFFETDYYVVNHDYNIDENGRVMNESMSIPGEIGIREKCLMTHLWIESTIFMLAISLMHCKNVSTKEVWQGGNRKLQELYHRGLPKLKYHYLIIDPMRKIVDKVAQEKGVGLKKALHMCRGHFKDYRQSGLFGRIPGIFWYESHLRGKITYGLVKKDYEVRQGPERTN